MNSFNREQIKVTAEENRELGSAGRIQKVENKSARDKAKDFSKHIPKPRIKQVSGFRSDAPNQHSENINGYGTAAEEYCISASNHDSIFDYGMIEETKEGISRLRELQDKHGENKKKVDAIKKSLGLA